MKIIVDANIVFSGILNTNGKIADLLLNSNNLFDFIAPEFLQQEINSHHSRLIKISKLTSRQVEEAQSIICEEIRFFSEDRIQKSTWKNAHKLTIDIDPKDMLYVAFSRHFRCKIWTGDKTLMKGLAKKGVHNFLTTDDLYKLREKLTRKNS